MTFCGWLSLKMVLSETLSARESLEELCFSFSSCEQDNNN